jgi:hypothetical protein
MLLHGHASDTNGVQIQTVGYFFGWFVFSVFAAYYAMKFAAARREERERVEKWKKKSEQP